MRTYSYALPSVSFSDGKVSAMLKARWTGPSGYSSWDEWTIDACRFVVEYSTRCEEVAKRNPDISAHEAEAVALKKWAAELDAAR